MLQLKIQHPEGQVDYSHLRAYRSLAPGSSGGVSVWEDARQWVEEEDRTWNKEQQKLRKTIRGAYGRFPLENSEELQSQPETAIGFWLFPLKAINSPRDISYCPRAACSCSINFFISRRRQEAQNNSMIEEHDGIISTLLLPNSVMFKQQEGQRAGKY